MFSLGGRIAVRYVVMFLNTIAMVPLDPAESAEVRLAQNCLRRNCLNGETPKTIGSVSFIFTVDEKDTVANNGKTYSGSFEFNLWPPVFSEVGTGKPLQEIEGTTAATRITVD